MNITKILLVFIIITVLFFSVYKYFYPSLSEIKIPEENLVGEYKSPTHEYELKIYFNGGILFHTDMSYLGVLEDKKGKTQKNIFLISPNIQDVKWIDNEYLLVNDIRISKNETYDFRNK